MNLIKGNEVNFPLSLEELQALSNQMHGHTQVRLNPDNKWTGQKHMDLRSRIDANIALILASPVPHNDIEVEIDVIDVFEAFARYIELNDQTISAEMAIEQVKTYSLYARQRREAKTRSHQDG